ncbi:Uncharacterised protein [uncultured archaeon]|nr:Uncharacterised protein [uncultured archaeon]
MVVLRNELTEGNKPSGEQLEKGSLAYNIVEFFDKNDKNTYTVEDIIKELNFQELYRELVSITLQHLETTKKIDSISEKKDIPGSKIYYTAKNKV